MSEQIAEIAEVAARAVHDYLVGFYCMGEPLPEFTSLLDVIEVALFENSIPIAHQNRTETVHAAEAWGVHLATGEIRQKGQGYYAMREAQREVERIAHNAAAEVGRSGLGIGWATAAHPAEVVSRTDTATTTTTDWRTGAGPDYCGCGANEGCSISSCQGFPTAPSTARQDDSDD